MKSIRTCALACMLPLAWSTPAPAAPHARMQIADQAPAPAAHPVARIASVPAAKARSRRVPHARVRKEDRRKDALPAPAKRATSNTGKADRSLAAAIRRDDAREAAERDARAERLYRSSQLSAPIIPGAKACRRTGAHGESIYENC